MTLSYTLAPVVWRQRMAALFAPASHTPVRFSPPQPPVSGTRRTLHFVHFQQHFPRSAP